MTVTVELRPELDSQLQRLAEASGMTVAEYVGRLVEQAIRREKNESAISLLSSWTRDDGKVDAEEEKRREPDWEDLKAALNKAHTSDRVLFP